MERAERGFYVNVAPIGNEPEWEKPVTDGGHYGTSTGCVICGGKFLDVIMERKGDFRNNFEFEIQYKEPLDDMQKIGICTVKLIEAGGVEKIEYAVIEFVDYKDITIATTA